MPDRQRRSDRKRLLAAGATFLFGLFIFCHGLWWVTGGEGDREQPYLGRGSVTAGLLAGAIFMVLALLELVHRVRNGPQKPGRRVKTDD